MQKDPQNKPVCNDWLTIPEASKAMKALGLPNFSLWSLRQMHRDKTLPFAFRTIGRKCWISRPSLEKYVTDVLEASGVPTVATTPLNSDPVEMITLIEAVGLLQTSGLPFSRYTAITLWREGRLPFPAAKIGGRLFVNKAVLLNYINNPAQ